MEDPRPQINHNNPHNQFNNNNNNNENVEVLNEPERLAREANLELQRMRDAQNGDDARGLNLWHAEDEIPEGVLDGGAIQGDIDQQQDEQAAGGEAELTMQRDLIILMHVTEELIPGIIPQNMKVIFGMDKTCKLKSLFEDFIKFCNLQKRKRDAEDVMSADLMLSDVEFVHHEVLNLKSVGESTADACALMKGDTLLVRKCQSKKRNQNAALAGFQKQIDINYFKEMRGLNPDMTAYGADVILDCQGRLDGDQTVLRTTVKAHSSILRQRCPWLGDKIDEVKRRRNAEIQEQLRRIAEQSEIFDESPDTVSQTKSDFPDEIPDDTVTNISAGPRPNEISFTSPVSNRRMSTEDTNIGPEDPLDDSLPLIDDAEVRRINNISDEISSPRKGFIHMVGVRENNDETTTPGVIHVEDDEEEEEEEDDRHSRVSVSRQSSNYGIFNRRDQYDTQDMTFVTLDHPPETVKLLLEFCYTNRCISLGEEAFKVASPLSVSPFSNDLKYANNGQPTVSMSVALAGISLAEDAGLKKLSLMCEVAAAKLMTTSNVLDALCKCTNQEKDTANPLPILRRNAMNYMLRGQTLFESNFDSNVKKRGSLLVPALLKGTKECLKHVKRQREETEIEYKFPDIDKEDRKARQRERKKWRR